MWGRHLWGSCPSRGRTCLTGAVLIRVCEPRDHASVEALWGAVFGYPEARNRPDRVLAEKLRVTPWPVLCLPS